MTTESTTALHQTLLERVNLATQAAGVRAFNRDLVGNHLTLDQTLPRACSASRST